MNYITSSFFILFPIWCYYTFYKKYEYNETSFTSDDGFIVTQLVSAANPGVKYVQLRHNLGCNQVRYNERKVMMTKYRLREFIKFT